MKLVSKTAALLALLAGLAACGGGIDAGIDGNGVSLGGGVDNVADANVGLGLGGLDLGLGLGK